ncbi:hypothetical protein Vi05172_g2223 [Venturia inaequalis]|nr:hypothetical protein Vi05172_g2223 [Venturia inaequalis]
MSFERPPIISAESTSQWVANNSMASALIGQPPNTQRDWYIARGLLRAVGMDETNPALGYVLAAQTTGNTESKRPSVIAGVVISLIIISSVTLTRLALRLSVSTMRFGPDDWATIAAAGMGLTSEDGTEAILDAMIAANLRKVMAKTRKTNTGGRSGYGDLDKSNTGLGPPCTAESTNSQPLQYGELVDCNV